MKFTWPVVTLVIASTVLVLGCCMALILTDKASANLLVVPFTALLAGIAAGVVFYFKGLVKMPPGYENATVETHIVRSITPPATTEELLGKTLAPPRLDSPLPSYAVGFDADAPHTPAETPTSKAKLRTRA